MKMTLFIIFMTLLSRIIYDLPRVRAWNEYERCINALPSPYVPSLKDLITCQDSAIEAGEE